MSSIGTPLDSNRRDGRMTEAALERVIERMLDLFETVLEKIPDPDVRHGVDAVISGFDMGKEMDDEEY